jgi:acyl-CoA dehydrogenase
VIDYAALDSAVGQNWYDLDPALQARVRRDSPPDDRAWAEDTLRQFGELIGGRVARNAETIDANPPELVRYDRWANEVNEVVHHPATLDSKRALWEAGYVSGFAAQEAERARPTPGVVHGATSYLLSQADTGLVCSLGMTSGVAGLVAAYAPDDVRERLLAGLRASALEEGTDGSMFLTEREGGSDLGRTVHCTARDIGDGRVLIDGEKWFCSNIDGAAIVMLARPEGAPEGPAGLGLYLVPRYLDDGSLNSISMRRLKPKLGTSGAPSATRCADGAARPPRRRTRAGWAG